MPVEQADAEVVGIDRLLALSDGVFAIALTLLVLDLHEPTVSHGVLGVVLRQWPAYLSYALSFLIIGIIWAQHHLMFRFIQRTDHVFILINVIFLMWVAVVPYPTGLLARYLDNPTERQTAIAIYTGVFALGGVLANLWWLYASRGDRLLRDKVDRAEVRKLTWNYAVGPVFYMLAFALSFVSPPAGVALIVLTNLFYAVSPLLARFLPSGS